MRSLPMGGDSLRGTSAVWIRRKAPLARVITSVAYWKVLATIPAANNAEP
jgi:hypothetical protein